METLSEKSWRNFYKIGGIAALLGVLIGLIESSITFLPGGTAETVTVVDWFTFFQQQPFMGLRNMGLLNMGFNALAIPAYLALYVAHRKAHRAYAALAMVMAFMGVAVFFATNRAFPMLALSRQYAIATDDAQSAALVAAGRAMLAVGASHTPGTFIAFFFSDVAGIVISAVMLRGKIFSKANAYAGIAGFTLLLIFEIGASFVWGLSDGAMLLAMFGGLLSMAWYVMLALRLLQLAKGPQ